MNHSEQQKSESLAAVNLECGTSLVEDEHFDDPRRPEYAAVLETNQKHPSSLESLRELLTYSGSNNNNNNNPLTFVSPYGTVPLVYADHTASNRPHPNIERYMESVCLPLYGNTHTNTSITGSQRSVTLFLLFLRDQDLHSGRMISTTNSMFSHALFEFLQRTNMQYGFCCRSQTNCSRRDQCKNHWKSQSGCRSLYVSAMIPPSWIRSATYLLTYSLTALPTLFSVCCYGCFYFILFYFIFPQWKWSHIRGGIVD
jgi:hypothetical protein